MQLLVISFFLTALIYAAAGFAGGSTYTALLVLHATDYRVLPTISLACNILVATGGVWRFGRAGQIAKLSDLLLLRLVEPYWALPLAVILGGQIGSWSGAKRLDAQWMRILTALLIFYAAVRLLLRWRKLVAAA